MKLIQKKDWKIKILSIFLASLLWLFVMDSANPVTTIELSKEVPIVPYVKGTPAQNYIDGIRRVSPENALITGKSAALSSIYELRTEQIDIEGASKDVNVSRALVVPKGVKLYNTPALVNVFVQIEKIASKEFLYTEQDIIIEDNNDLFEYEIPKEIKIKLLGNKVEIEKLDKADIKPLINVGALKEGVHRVPLKVTLSGTIKLQEDYDIEIKIKKKE